MHHVAATPVADLNDPLALELRAALPSAPTAATVVPALLAFRSIFDRDVAEHETFVSLLLHWYRTIETEGLEGLRNEINHD
jgi:fructuronate reductase